MKRINILIADDNRLLRDGLATILSDESDFNVIGKFGGFDFFENLRIKLEPDIIIIDISIAKDKDFQIIKKLVQNHPDIKIMVMGMLPDQEDISGFIEAGVAGFLLKESTINEFVSSIRSVERGEKILPPRLSLSLFNQIAELSVRELGKKALKEVALTKREKEFIKLIADGKSNKEIASEINVSIHTVKSHVHNILEKLALNNRLQIANYSSGMQESI